MTIGIQYFPTFIASAVILVVMPGPDMLLVVSRALADGRAAGVAAVLGITAGSLIYTAAVAFGFTQFVAVSPMTLGVARLAGAGYFILLGVHLLAKPTALPALGNETGDKAAFWRNFRHGILINLVNPKVGLFFFALLPQFVESSLAASPAPYIALGLILSAIGAAWLVLLVATAARARATFIRQATRALWTQRAAGLVLALLGARFVLYQVAP